LQPGNHDKHVTIKEEGPHSSNRLAQLPRKNYAEINDPWYKPPEKPTDTVFVSRNSGPIIAPDSFHEMKSHEDHDIWEAAMQMEIEQDCQLNVWELTDLPEDHHPIGC